MAVKSLILSRYLLPRAGCVRGPRLAQYEQAFAAAIGAPHAVGFWKGRVAFYAALKALGVGPGDDVVLPGYTCMVVSAAIRILGANPVYIDIEPEYCTLDPDKLPRSITPRTKVLMIQHTYGWPSFALDRVVDFAAQKGLPIVEDSCHALGTRQQGRHMGTFGVAAFFSSQWSKPYATGLGGLLACNDADLHKRVIQLREQEACLPSPSTAAQLALQGMLYDLLVYPKTMALARNMYRWLSRKSIVTGSTSMCEYTGVPADYLRTMCEVQAAAGLHELKKLPRVIAHRRRIGEVYTDQLRAAGWPVPAWPADADVTLLRFPVRVSEKAAVLELAERKLVELGDWFIRPLHSHLAPQEDFGYVTGMCPQAEKAAAEIVNLPMHERVGLREAQRVLRFFQKHARPAEGTRL